MAITLASGLYLAPSPPQSITDQQHATLTALVAHIAARLDLSHQKIWTTLHQRFENRRGHHLKRADFDAAWST
ncbi:MAG: hypothetical protein HQM01_02090 [Magnetococcales bacterium]|nr:hypothetical protein [Magnetococcales bacterium]